MEPNLLDFSAEEVLSGLRNFSKDNIAASFLMVGVMSHGDCRDNIMFKDRILSVDEIVDALDNNNTSQPKVKIFMRYKLNIHVLFWSTLCSCTFLH